MKNPYYRVNLDEFGTWVWLRCDGHRTVKEIADGLSEAFGDQVQPVYDRLTLFLRQLVRGHFITFRAPPPST